MKEAEIDSLPLCVEGLVIPREGVERRALETYQHPMVALVIPREGVESGFGIDYADLCPLSLVIPREGVER